MKIVCLKAVLPSEITALLQVPEKREARMPWEADLRREPYPRLIFENKKIEPAGNKEYRGLDDLTIRGVPESSFSI